MNESYRDFAPLYDALTFDVNYAEMADFIKSRLHAHGIKEGLVLDLACGTGTLTLELKSRGYDMIAADASEDMLMLAREKEGSEGVLYLNQPMEDFELYGTVDAIVCALDSLNYLTDFRDVEKTFKLCENYLNPGGILLFDVNSAYKFEHILGQNTYSYERDNIFYVWENDYDEKTKLCELYLNFFVGEKDGSYLRFDEVHVQRNHAKEELEQALVSAGFKILNIYDGYEKRALCEHSERLLYEVQKIR